MKGSSRSLWHLALYIANHPEADLAYFINVVWKCFGWIRGISLELSEAATNNWNVVMKIIKNWLYAKLFPTLNLDPSLPPAPLMGGR